MKKKKKYRHLAHDASLVAPSRQHQHPVVMPEELQPFGGFIVFWNVWILFFKVWILGGVGFGVLVVKCGVWGLGFGIRGVGCGVWGLGCEVLGLGFGVLRFEVWGLGFGVWGLGCGVWGLGSGGVCLDAAFAAPTVLEATQVQIRGFFSQLPYKCHLEEVASVGD